MSAKSNYEQFIRDKEIKRWVEDLRSRSYATAKCVPTNLASYCRDAKTTPQAILKLAKSNSGKLKAQFSDFVRKWESEGKSGAYLGQIKAAINSWLKYNDIMYRIKVNIRDELISKTTRDEVIPTREQLDKILRRATTRQKVEISLIAFSGLRLEVMANAVGNDGLRLKDLEDLDIDSLKFRKVPAKVNIKEELSKARNRYFTFIPEVACQYIIDYLDERKRDGETLTPLTPLILPHYDKNWQTKTEFLQTFAVSGDIKKAIRGAGFDFRPYVFRAYFATNLDIAESKGVISHSWRQFLMGHKGDMEAKYSTNKRWLPENIEEIRNVYSKCTKFFNATSGDDKDVRYVMMKGLLMAAGMKEEEIDNLQLTDMPDNDFQKLLAERLNIKLNGNGKRQKVVTMEEFDKYFNDKDSNWEYLTTLPDGRVILKLHSP
jgi:site-specific recombinase XerC